MGRTSNNTQSSLKTGRQKEHYSQAAFNLNVKTGLFNMFTLALLGNKEIIRNKENPLFKK